MARLIQKSGYIKNGKATGYMEYVATRDGVEIIQSTEPVTKKQEQFIQKLLKDFPDAKELFEYSDYLQVPNRGTASAFIATTLDTHLHEVESESGYMSYIAQRPRAEKHGGHGLFSEVDTTDLKAAKAELKAHGGKVWTFIFSLRREDAERLGYLRYGSDPHSTQAGDVLHAPVSGKGKYGAVVSEKAATIDGYNCVSNLSQSIVLRPDNSQDEIIFYYEPLQYTVEYRVWAYNGGTLDNTLEVVEGNNAFRGSVSTAKRGYTFVGWYQDAECTIPVGEKGTVDDATGQLKPERSELLPAPQTNVFYARFKAVYGNVTIERKAREDKSSGVGTYVYRLTSKDNPACVVEVTACRR